ncbi:DNA polymerase III beta subunit [Labilithrix luteola]|uniref:Beta sliding clamp n=1 Tax=Labilithrix luteola TaxID=1391654 RepID=A0A0K1QCL9_9BACT|nr:DNA polymerase III subunit beta [Labilithrix luteola]AKV03175.1 DNA polymerase III beta subunit [Labilithrix luteola]
MQITAAKKDLVRALARAQGIANRKSTIAALACVLLQTIEGDRLQIAATDLFVTVVDVVALDGPPRQTGGVALNARDLLDRVKALPDGPVHIETSERATATIRGTGKLKYTLRGLPADDYPSLPSPKARAAELEIPANALAGLLDRVHFAISQDTTRAHVNSSLLAWGNGEARMAATDGHRLSVAACFATAPKDGRALLSQAAVTELRKIVGELGDEPITVRRDGSVVFFVHGNVTFGTKLVDAEFPPYEQVIPNTSASARAQIPRKAFADAVRAVALASDFSADQNGASGVGVIIALGEGVAHVSCESARKGLATNEVPIEYAGKPHRVRVEPRYVLEVLGCLEDEEVEAFFTGELHPIVFRPATGDTFVVMPMRL